MQSGTYSSKKDWEWSLLLDHVLQGASRLGQHGGDLTVPNSLCISLPFCTSFLLLWENIWRRNLKEKNLFLARGFGCFPSVFFWLSCFSALWWNRVAGSLFQAWSTHTHTEETKENICNKGKPPLTTITLGVQTPSGSLSCESTQGVRASQSVTPCVTLLCSLVIGVVFKSHP